MNNSIILFHQHCNYILVEMHIYIYIYKTYYRITLLSSKIGAYCKRKYLLSKTNYFLFHCLLLVFITFYIQYSKDITEFNITWSITQSSNFMSHSVVKNSVLFHMILHTHFSFPLKTRKCKEIIIRQRTNYRSYIISKLPQKKYCQFSISLCFPR